MVTKLDLLAEQIATLDKRLATLEQKKWVGGANIRITQIDETLMLIEQANTGPAADTFAMRLTETEEKLDDLLNNTGWIAGDGLILKTNGSKQILELDPDRIATDPAAESAASAMDDFPFRVRLDHSTPSTGAAKNFILCAGGSTMPEALVYAGTNAPIKIEPYTFQTAENCCIYLLIKLQSEASGVNPGTITAEVVRSSSFPDPDNAQYIVPIARIVFQEGRALIHQMQFGNVYIAGRVI